MLEFPSVVLPAPFSVPCHQPIIYSRQWVGSNLEHIAQWYFFKLMTKPTRQMSAYRHSLTLHVRRYVVIAMKPVHWLQICPIMNN